MPTPSGIVGLVVAFLISLFSSLGRDSALITTVAGFVMAVLYTLCAGLLTFDNGPATYVGNHYFSAWAGFFISFAVFGSVLKEFLGVGGTTTAAAAASETTGGEFILLSSQCGWSISILTYSLFSFQSLILRWTGSSHDIRSSNTTESF